MTIFSTMRGAILVAGITMILSGCGGSSASTASSSGGVSGSSSSSGAGSSSSSSSSSSSGGSSGGTVQGIATPSGVSVVTATNAN